jgi:anaerobic magnesium-protoporphyrin IX monomethyl ester cyclase
MKLLLVWLDIRHNAVLNPHHGLAWLAGYMKNEGHIVKCLYIQNKVADMDRFIDEIESYQPDCVGFSLTTNQRQYLDEFVNACRQKFTGLIVVGGTHATLAPEDTLKCKNVDGVCIGEGERAMALLGERLDNNKSYYDIPSFRWRVREDANAGFVDNGVEMFEKDLSKLPYPDYSIFDMKRIILKGAVSGYMPVMISRGCPYICTYCSNKAIKSVYQKSVGYFRILEPRQAIELLKFFKESFSIRGFNFADDLLICNVKWFSEFTKLYIDEINLPYVCNSRIEMLQTREIAVMLKESGCRQLSFGLESGDEQYRREMLKRNYSNEQIITAAHILHEVGVPFSSYNIMGLPFETKEQMEKTLAINISIRPESGMVFFFYPYPGTELHKLCLGKGLMQSEKINTIDSFMEMPVIEFVNCSENSCRKIKQKLFLYFKTRKLATYLGINSRLFDAIVYRIMCFAPKFFIFVGKGKFLRGISVKK